MPVSLGAFVPGQSKRVMFELSVQRWRPWHYFNLCTASHAAFTMDWLRGSLVQLSAWVVLLPTAAGPGGNEGGHARLVIIRHLAWAS